MPGFIDIKHKGFVQAGGAIGAFVLILLAFKHESSPQRLDCIGL